MHALFIQLFQPLNLLLICTFLNRLNFHNPLHFLSNVYAAFGNHIWMTLSASFHSSLSFLCLFSTVLLLFNGSLSHKFGSFKMGKWHKKDDILSAVYSLTLSPLSFFNSPFIAYSGPDCVNQRTYPFFCEHQWLHSTVLFCRLLEKPDEGQIQGEKSQWNECRKNQRYTKPPDLKQIQKFHVVFCSLSGAVGWKIMNWRRQSVVDHPCRLSLSRLLILACALSLSLTLSLHSLSHLRSASHLQYVCPFDSLFPLHFFSLMRHHPNIDHFSSLRGKSQLKRAL